ncbi:hypothetical protein VTO42DRAFT_3863 [Malbranchea cinnamomea]
MVLAVLPALIPDIPRVYEIYFSAFKHDEMGRIMVDILFPNTDIFSEEFRTSHAAATRSYWHTSDVQYTFKCVDMETGEIVGMALGDVFVRPRSEEERRNPGVTWLQGKERERAEKVLNPLWEMREKLFGGRPYIYSHVMAVDPKHQGRKAGAALLRWGMDLSERTGLPIYFESSPSTVRMYEKAGFERLEETIVHKAEVMGTDSDIEVPLMVRMPSCARGMTFKEWREKGYPQFPQTAASSS